MKVLDLFSGIGGFALGLEAAGFETAAFCEIDPYAQKVLKKNWPGVPIYDDVRRITADRLVSDGIGVDVITGGFPCQDISVAGNQKGIDAERSGLWSECSRLLGDIRPRYAIFENVTNLLTGDGGDWFKRVLWDISSVGYDAEWHCIPASAIGAYHHRDRVWIVAYPNGDDRRGGDSSKSQRRNAWLEPWGSGEGQLDTETHKNMADSDSERGCSRDSKRQDAGDAGKSPILTRDDIRRVGPWDAEPNVGRVANGVPARSHRLRCLGNAVVPQIPELIGRQIMEVERGRA
jgi:DNA (cytosine-5)-methyltransferase 1